MIFLIMSMLRRKYRNIIYKHWQWNCFLTSYLFFKKNSIDAGDNNVIISTCLQYVGELKDAACAFHYWVCSLPEYFPIYQEEAQHWKY